MGKTPSFQLVSDDMVANTTFFAGFLAMLMSGSVYAWAVYSEDLKTTMGYTQTELGLIPAIGDNGLYLAGIFVGIIFNLIGEFWCMMLATFFVGGGYLLMALTYSGYLIHGEYYMMTIYFTMIGIGSSFGYIIPLTCVITNTPVEKKGKTVGLLMGGFGISAFLLANVGKSFYKGNTYGFFIFCAIFAVLAYMNGALFIRRKKSVVVGTEDEGKSKKALDLDVEEPLLLNNNNNTETQTKINVVKKKAIDFSDILTMDYLLLYIAFSAITGAGLMYINSLSQIFKSNFGPQSDHENETEDEFQDLFNQHKTALVSLLSFSNCFGRILFGFISDYFSKKFHLILYIWVPVITVLMAVFQLLPIYFHTVNALYVITTCMGLCYGAAFACWPCVLGQRYGNDNYSINWGFLTSGCGIMGTVMISVFGNVYDDASSVNNVTGISTCFGKECYQQSFMITACYLFVLGVPTACIGYKQLSSR